MTEQIAGLEQIADRIDGLLVDQYGVLHDGRTAFPGARDALDRMAARGVPMVAVTNSGKRAAPNAARLERLGFPTQLFRGVISSGELAHVRIAAMLADGTLPAGARIALITTDEDQSVLDGLDVRVVAPGAPADMVLIAGARPLGTRRADYAAALAPCARTGVPALLANPDTVAYTAQGPAFGPGVIAEDYAAAGGPVTALGKPGRAMFEAGLALLGLAAGPRVWMIGDSPAHDIAGATDAGLSSLLVAGGVQAGTSDAVATAVIPRLAW